MPVVAPTTSTRINELASAKEFELPTGDQTETFETDELSGVVICANQPMEIHVPGLDGTYSSRPPSGSTIWVEPTATLAGHLHTLLPPRFFVANNSGSTGKCTVHLIGRPSSGAVPAPA